jgi:nitrogen fixation-related uncharacterized protein
VRSFLSLLLALVILLSFGGVVFFLWNISSKAKFERNDKQPETVQPG